ncbi:hypothetical protein WL30_24530 [Burkholderia ubonensis]|uniref:hypothetical protein n=1 Tax=Burkholderia ubonensis TaxID=101571 RepID=UPI00075662FF|nr:hypothetical protein [Burkholderia ubonensis]KWA81682.1 hypothetical protein WL30_24530 [Burkholderia ubonensis]KWB34702.1 hypothetical protein WL31_22220 [Burkholderia ubonensis]OJA64477.1 hypothetical protein BGV68_01325 [Burkholderia ubonensis]
MDIKVSVVEIAPGAWVIERVSPVGASRGRSTYPSADVAAQVARERDPQTPIAIVPLSTR